MAGDNTFVENLSGSATHGEKTLDGGFAGRPFSEVNIEDEYFHPSATSQHYSSTETSYFGFNIPQSAINGEIYLWFHPVLKVFSASVFIWRGFKPTSLACDYVNHHHYLPWPANGNEDLLVQELGLRIRVVEPLRTIQIDLQDDKSDVSLSVLYSAIMPPAGRPGGFHFTQAMKTQGWLNLRGERHEIDGYFSRDRSWSQERRENPMPLPPLTWTVGVFDDDLAFHFLAHDDPARGAEWKDAYPSFANSAGLFWGYVWREGRLCPIRHVSKITHRDRDGVSPVAFDVRIEDADGEVINLTGKVRARAPWQTWQNMNTFFCQVEWHADGRTGYGDAQDVQFGDYVRKFTTSSGAEEG